MKKVLAFFALISVLLFTSRCGPSGSGPVFCDTACHNEPIVFNGPGADSPFVKISVSGCQPDSIIWSHLHLASNKKMSWMELVGKPARLNPSFVKCFFKDTTYAWLTFNDCITGRGFAIKLPFTKTDKWSVYTSALNAFDKKYKVADGLIAYYDETFLYVQDMETGAIDRALLNDTPLEIDHNKPHETFDEVDISKTRIHARVKVKGEWKTIDRPAKLVK